MRHQQEVTSIKRREIVQWRNADGTKGFASKTFPAGTRVSAIEQWIADERRKHHTGKPLDGSLGADVERHLSTHTGQRSWYQRACYLRLWLAALGRDRRRQSVTTDEIDAVVEHWRTAPATRTTGKSCPDGVGAGTLIKRLMWLKLFFADVNAPQEINPVAAAAWPARPKSWSQRRDRPYDVIERIIAAMPLVGPSKKKGEPRPISLSRIRVRVLAYTGLPPGMLAELDERAIDWRTRELITPEREKGERVESRRVPLADDAFAAFGDLRDAHGFGAFDVGTLNRVFQRAARSIGERGVSLYALRHSFGTEAYRITGDRATVGRLMLHAKNSPTTDRYIDGATDDVDRRAVKNFGKSLVKKRRGTIHVAPTQKRRAS